MSDAAKFPSQLAERFQIRLPDGMRDELRKAAQINNRSMNAEIIARIDKTLSEEKSKNKLSKASEELISLLETEPSTANFDNEEFKNYAKVLLLTMKILYENPKLFETLPSALAALSEITKDAEK